MSILFYIFRSFLFILSKYQQISFHLMETRSLSAFVRHWWILEPVCRALFRQFPAAIPTAASFAFLIPSGAFPPYISGLSFLILFDMMNLNISQCKATVHFSVWFRINIQKKGVSAYEKTCFVAADGYAGSMPVGVRFLRPLQRTAFP